MCPSTCMVSNEMHKCQGSNLKQIFATPFIRSIIFIAEKEDVKVQTQDKCQTIAHTNSENDSSSEFQACLDRAEDLSRRIRALSPISEANENTNATSNIDSNPRFSRRQSVMIRRIFEKYSDIIGRLALTMAVFYYLTYNKSFVCIDYKIELLH